MVRKTTTPPSTILGCEPRLLFIIDCGAIAMLVLSRR